MMKKNFKVITLVVSLLLLMGAVIGISAFAEETAPSIEIVRKNVSYEGAVKTLFVIDTENAEGCTIKVNFYDVNPATAGAEVKYTKGVDGKTTIDGVEYDVVFSKGIAPADLRKNFYAVPVLVDTEGNVVAQGDAVEYSPYIYAINRFAKNPTDDQVALYTALLDYGAAVQRLLCKPEDVAANGGYADEYCGIREDIALNGVVKENGSVKYYAPGTEVKLTATNMYGDDGVFAYYSDKSGEVAGTLGYTKKTVVAENPGVSVYTGNYTVTGQVFNTYDSLCIDGSANDVNNLYAGKKAEAKPALGFYTNDGLFGNKSSDMFVKVAKESESSVNQVIYGYNNGINNNLHDVILSADRTVYGARKYIVQMDFKWDGIGEDTAKTVAYFRITGTGFADANTLYNIALDDAGASSETYTLDGVELNKNEWYTLRFEVIPHGQNSLDFNMYINGELKETKTNLAPVNDANNADKFSGMRIYTRLGAYGGSSYYSYQLDNTYIGYETRGTGDYFASSEISGSRVEYDDIATPNTDNILSSDSYHAFAPAVFDGALSFAGQGYNVGFKNNGSKVGDYYVFETDIKFDGKATGAKATDQFGSIGMSASGCATANMFPSLCLFYRADANGNIEYIELSRYVGSNLEVLVTMNHGEWYNLRIEYTVENSAVSIYLNNNLASTFTNSGSVDTTQFSCVGLWFRAYSSSSIEGMNYYLDNTFMGAVSEKVELGTGKYFSDSNVFGTKNVYDDITAPGKDNVFTSDSRTDLLDISAIENGALTFAGQGYNVGFQNNGAKIGESYVFETDIKFDGKATGAKTSDQFGSIGMSASGCATANMFPQICLFYKTDANGNIEYIELSRYVGSKLEVLATLNHGEWYNLRIEYTVETAVVDIYVNNNLASSFTNSSSVDATQFDCVGLWLRGYASSGLDNMQYYLDNTFIGAITEMEEAAVFILLGQSNAVGHGTPMEASDIIDTPLSNVYGLSRAKNQSFDISTLTFSGYTSAGMNLGEEQDDTYSVANCLAAEWQAAIDAGEDLPDLYIIHIAIGAEGVGEYIENGEVKDLYMWNPDYPTTLVPGRLGTVDISLYSFTTHILSMVEDSLNRIGKTAAYTQLHWRGGENDVQDYESLDYIDTNLAPIYDTMFEGFYSALGETVPTVLHRIMLDPAPNTNKPLAMQKINELFERYAEENSNMSIFDPREAPHYDETRSDKGIFIQDRVHYSADTNKWVASEILENYKLQIK